MLVRYNSVNRVILKTIFVLTLIGLSNIKLISQPNFRVITDTVVTQGDFFRINFSCEGEGKSFTPPDLSKFTSQIGPSISNSKNVRIINSKVVSSIITNNEFMLKADKIGKYKIGKASIIINDTIYYSKPIVIEVKGKIQLNHATIDEIISPEALKDSVFVRLELDKRKVYKGEQIVATIKIYDLIGLDDVNDIRLPQFTEFWQQAIETPTMASAISEKYNDKKYNTYLLRKYFISPLSSGVLTIEPFHINCKVRIATGQKPDFFGRIIKTYSSIPVTLLHIKEDIEVVPLPEIQPSDFSGAVGTNLVISSSTNTTEPKCNEPFIYEITIKGNANLQLIDKPNIKFPSSFSVIDSLIKLSIDSTLTSTVKYEYRVIPRKNGKLTIPAVKFTYFDTKTGSYKNILSRDHNLIVKSESWTEFTSDITNSKKGLSPDNASLIFVVDASGSMRARDFKPNRLNATKEALIRYSKNFIGNNVGLVVFRGESYTVMSLNNQLSLIKKAIKSIDTIGVDGTNIGNALALAINHLKESNSKQKTIILLTDGVNNNGVISPLTSANIAQNFNIKIYTLGIGCYGKAPYPVMGYNGLEFQEHEVEIDEKTLKEISKITGGKYYRVQNEDSFNSVFSDLNKHLKSNNVSIKTGSTLKTKQSTMYSQDIERVLNAIRNLEKKTLKKLKEIELYKQID